MAERTAPTRERPSPAIEEMLPKPYESYETWSRRLDEWLAQRRLNKVEKHASGGATPDQPR